MDLLIKNILMLAINENDTNRILEENFEIFRAAFTSRGFDEYSNYEYFEQIGDLSINKFIITYMGKRFPQLRSSNGVGVLASLRILYGSKDTLSHLTEKLGMDKFVKCTQEEMIDKNKFKSILEDVFEAFFGALEFSMDKMWYHGIGYISVYNILEKIFDDINIKIDYESLVDAKTRLNELKDEKKLNIKYKDNKLDDGTFFSELFLDNNKIGEGYSNVKKTAQIIASENGLNWIETNMNIKKEIPDRYKIMSSKTW